MRSGAADTRRMEELLAGRVAWRRKSLRQQYVGRLLVLPDRLRLVGREPAFGIDVALSIPFGQITGVREATRSERVLGDTGVVLELAGSEPVVLRELGSAAGPRSLARELSVLVSRPPELAVSA
jgi:hypothetical protein